MDYSKMSDFEINKAVAELQDCADDFYITEYTVSRHCKNGYTLDEVEAFDPCNNPSDAWPIIIEIWSTLMSIVSYDYGVGLGESKTTLWDARAHMYGDDKLRAAMICYLMLKEDESGC